ncbi:MAG TPA: protein kinase [Gemmatimonadales bacterium]|nr:protein kinase [Gemmatimonadales bacterium]
MTPVGAGGMGEVYRATDTKLGREVAIKVLPESVARDPDRLARFDREARALAALNHPNIAHIYGLEESDGVKALVMELVEGPTLADRIAGQPIPVDEALPIVRQIADALEAAHEQGIIHRDLKPSNVKVRPDGAVKVLDFGLAKAIEPTSPTSPGQSMSPTITTPAMTQAGMILGTAAYMSPEQARGKPVDKRADIWAFGCVLFEMLSGRRAFDAASVTETLAAVLERQVDWSVLPPSTPPGVRTVLRRALEKDPKRRLRDIADARIEIDDNHVAPVSTPSTSTRGRGTTLPWMIVTVVIAIVVGGTAWNLRAPATAPAAVTRFVVDTAGPVPADVEGVVALSPDARRLAYVAAPGGQRRLYLLEMDQFESKPLADTEGASDPAFSPDGNWIAFTAAGRIKKISVADGTVVALTDARYDRGASLSWESNDSLLIGASGHATGIWRVPATGGVPTAVTTLHSGEVEHRNPAILPDGKGLLYSEAGQLIAESLGTGDRHNLGSGTHPRYISTGHVVYARGNVLYAVPFDPVRLEPLGKPTVVLQGIGETRESAAVALSDSGSIAYLPAGAVDPQSALVWVDRDGTEHETFVRGLRISRPRLAPDGQRVAAVVESDAGQGQNLGDIWIYRLVRGTSSRITFDGRSTMPAWSPDGRLAYGSDDKDGRSQLHIRTFSGAGSDVTIPSNRGTNFPFSWSPDGRFLATVSVDSVTRNDIWVLPIDDSPQWRPFVNSQNGEGAPTFSPDGTWIAYASDKSGRTEIYMRPYPGPGEEETISTVGGNEPIWVRSGELFYRQGDAVMVVKITTTPTVSVGKPLKVLESPYARSDAFWQNYAVSPDGQRLLMIKATGREVPARLHVVLNWAEELKRQVPAK